MSAVWTDEHAPPSSREAAALRDLSMTRFAAALASLEPSPGGSTAAALPAALAAGLVAMSARSTVACAPFSDLAFDMDAAAREADELRAELLGLLDEDADAFEEVMTARRLPRTTLEQQTLRFRETQRAYEKAVEAPLRVCQRSLRVLELAADVAERGHPHAATDADVAMLFAAASLEVAAVTAEIYLLPVESEAFRAARREELQVVRARAGLSITCAPRVAARSVSGIPDSPQRGRRQALVDKEVVMREEKPESVRKGNARRFVRGGEAVAVLSVLFLVPFLRRRREHRHGHWHRHFVILGH